jgi:protein-disulfide isomerase/uncharacterized membrane protein
MTERQSTANWALGCVLAGVAALMALLLSIQHFGGLHLPGCGDGGACDQAARSAWGKLPGTGWPVSHLGAAFFVALLTGWALSRGRPRPSLRWMARLGAAVSVSYGVIIVAGGYSCPYCIAAHAANLAFWLVSEIGARVASAPAGRGRPEQAEKRGKPPSLRPTSDKAAVWISAVAFVLVTAAFGTAEVATRDAARRHAERSAAESTREIIAATSQKAAAQATVSMSTSSPTATKPTERPTSASAISGPPPATPPAGGFTGRWRLGPEKAPIRIVICSDYQCKACKQVEGELRDLFKTRKDVSISMKHYPVCMDCNRYMTKTMHRNACWAARAAETAGILRGNDAFWEMHFALFDRGGSFTDAELKQLLVQLQYDPPEFERMMTSDEPLRRVKQDIDDAMAVGMRYTPLVMINGVELRGWETPGTIARTVAQLAATNPPALGADADRPPPAAERLVDEWRKEPSRELPVGKDTWWTGPENAKIEVVMFVDYQEPTVAKADAAIREEMRKRGDVRYAIVQYPFNKECNPTVTTVGHAQGCWAAKAAIAAGRLGGAAGYWKMHEWLLSNQSGLNDSALLDAAPSLGFEGVPLLAEIQRAEVSARIASECQAGKRIGLTALPTIYVNRKQVAIWDYYGQILLGRILDAAAEP